MKIRKLSKKQRLVMTWWRQRRYREFDAVICDGAVRSGKTLIMASSFMLWAMASFSGGRFAMCGKTIVSLRRNVLDEVLPVIRSLGFECRETVSRNTVTVSGAGRENTFYLFGGKDEGSAAHIQGVTLCGVLFDEVALQPRSFVEQACARCSVPGSKFWFNCNPEGPEHWFYREWIRNADARRALYLHFTMRDNPSLTGAIRRRYERMYSGTFYDRFVLGKWVCAEGCVYDFFDGRYVRPVPAGRFEKWYISCDYGTVNPTSFGLWGLQNGVWYRVSEYYFDSRRAGRQKTDEEYGAALAALAGGRRIEAVIVDPSAASFIEVLRRRGYSVIRAKNDVLSGIRLTADMLKSGRLVICRGCDDSIREFSQYVWDLNAPGDVPVKRHDHAMDDIRYFAATVASAPESSFAATYVER